MADWVATFTFGLISNAQRIDSISPPEVNENLTGFRAAFLLIQLGGPDTITAFSLEDNALLMCHLVGVVAQLSTFFYIFFKTVPKNNLIAPTILIAVAGAIKYGERTRSLYLASMENLRKSTGKLPVTSLEALEGDYFPDENTGKEAYYFFQIFKALVVEINPNHTERAQSRELFLQKDAREAFYLMVAELNLLFELFYMKISSVNSSSGVIVRIIRLYSVTGALILYSLLEKKGFHEVDIWITYFLQELSPEEKKGGVSRNVFDAEIRDFIFKELKERASAADDEDQVKEIYEARGSWILKKLGNSDGLMRYVKKFDYDRSLLVWHIATEICHNANRAVEAADSKQRKLAIKLSYYMHYLLIKKPGDNVS